MEGGISSDPMDISKYDMETDISQMEAPTFTTIDRSNPASMLALDWDHKVNLVGKKVLNPMIHCCDKCLKPILIYGRMIPCKHVFCLGCAKQEGTTCPRCGDKVNRVEQAGLGNIFLCTQDGSRYGNNGCRRTYLSSRDLAAHVAHRHKEKGAKEEGGTRARKLPDLSGPLANISKASLASVVAAVNSAQAAGFTGQQGYSGQPAYQGDHGSHISVLNSRPGNLISIHTGQESAAAAAGSNAAPPAGGAVQGGGYTAGYPAAGPGAYSAYPASTAAPPPAGNNYPNMSQPPPTFGYSGAGGYTAPGPAPYPTPGYGGAGGPTQPAGYPQGPAPGGGVGQTSGYSSGPASSQGVGPGGYNGGQYGSGQGGQYGGQQWTRPPPAQGGQGYFRR